MAGSARQRAWTNAPPRHFVRCDLAQVAEISSGVLARPLQFAPAMTKLLALVLPFALALGAFEHPAVADQPGAHPAYLHALTDLRTARWNLQRRRGDSDVKWDESRAIGDIDAAIHKIKEAAIDDGKNLDDHPPADAGDPPYRGRLHKALDSLRAAKEDVNKEEDNEYAQHLKHRAIQDIDSAIHRTREALCNAGDNNFCGG
jgi:hypothetical protein